MICGIRYDNVLICSALLVVLFCVCDFGRSVFCKHLEMEVWYVCSARYKCLLQYRTLITKRDAGLKASQLTYTWIPEIWLCEIVCLSLSWFPFLVSLYTKNFSIVSMYAPFLRRGINTLWFFYICLSLYYSLGWQFLSHLEATAATAGPRTWCIWREGTQLSQNLYSCPWSA